MDIPEKSFSDLIGSLKPWIPWRPESPNVSRDFWMPDHSCRVCYDCDSQFTLFNRRHHCRHCGRVFCAKCTSNWVPAPSSEPSTAQEDFEKVRVCNFCFKQWEQGLASADYGIQVPNLALSTSPSSSSLVSTKSVSSKSLSPKSTGTVDSNCTSFVSVPPSFEFCENHPFALSPRRSTVMDMNVDTELGVASEGNNDPLADIGNPSPCERSCLNRNDDDEDGFQVDQLDNGTREFPEVNGYYAQVEFVETVNGYSSHRVHPDGEILDRKSSSTSPLHDSFDSGGSVGNQPLVKKSEHDGDESEASSSLYPAPEVEAEPVDFENNGLLWLPPEPEDAEDEREALLFDDDDEGDTTGEWGYLRQSSSFGSGEHRIRDRSNEEHKKAVKNVVDGHFRALVAQLLQVENLLSGEEDERESWLEIITSLSWEAATLLKPDTSKGGGMDPGGYVKVKCIASGRRSDSMVVKGVVCKKNVAHRRMTSKIDKARLLILGGALEYQRVSNALSSFDTLLQQEMDHLKMAVAKIDAHQPDVLLVEKSVSRFAQEYLLAKDISLVLNIKRPLLERIARCTGGQIVPSIDHLSSQKLGYCDMFHVERFLEEHGTAGQGGKKLVKTLMYFEGCPKPLGCTILLRGANGDELKKVKHVVQYGVFAAYHLALETSFLADEGASLPALPLNSPITVALPDKPSSIDRSISTIPGFSALVNEKTQELPVRSNSVEPVRSNSVPTTGLMSSVPSVTVEKVDTTLLPVLPRAPTTQGTELTASFINPTAAFSSLASGNVRTGLLSNHSFHEKRATPSKEYLEERSSEANNSRDIQDQSFANGFEHMQGQSQGPSVDSAQDNSTSLNANNEGNSEVSNLEQDVNPRNEQDSSKEEFPPSPSDNQSILVSLSSRCVWKGTVCERSHLFRIKYYGNFDKPLGRFLRDHLFDQGYRCRSCDMPSEAHVHCYTHRQGTLTISVKKLPEILLPGEKDGKIWMWHRCLRCPRTNGFPPATRRIVMSDAAWGLSFGKFLELSFSNHAAASRVASCGHSLHRDCLRFYGFGKMVACFRYASIDVHSVYLPPHKLNFNYEDQDWIRKELNEVVEQAELLFSEVFNTLSKMAEKRSSPRPLNNGTKASESRRHLSDLEVMLQKEKIEFEESLQKVLKREVKKGQPVIDILEINRLRRQLLFQSYMWDHRLIYTANLSGDDSQNELTRANSEQVERISTLFSFNSLVDMNISVRQGKGHSSYDSSVVDLKLSGKHDGEGVIGTGGKQSELIHQGSNVQRATDQGAEHQVNISAGVESANVGSETIADGTLSDCSIHRVESLSDTLDAAWRGDNSSGLGVIKPDSGTLHESAAADSRSDVAVADKSESGVHGDEQNRMIVPNSPSMFSSKGSDYVEDSVGWLGMPFISFYRSLNMNFLGSAQKLNTLSEHNPVYVSSFRELEHKTGARLLLPVGVNDTVIPIYDDEPTSIISYALVSPDYLYQLSDEGERTKESAESTMALHSVDSGLFQSLHSFDEMALESYKSLGSMDDSSLSISASRGSGFDPVTKSLHARVSFSDEGPLGKVKYTVTCYYAKRFDALRRICCPSEIDFVRSLSRCKKWGAQGGKSNVFFAKTLDDRFIIKQVTKTELESFTKFAPEYFKYLSESIGTGSPTCLAKILGIYQVTSKHLKGGKELKMDVLVMENLLFARNLTRLYDLKGSSRSRYNPDVNGSNKVLLDQNLIEAMPTSPIFVGNKAKRLLERAVWNDTSFLASIDVMDYSLLVGVDEENHELVMGIIDFMRQYTWDKHLETWVKASGILGGPKNASPTVISPKQYKKRFRKAMTTYFLMVPDQWSPPSIIPSKSQIDLAEDNAQGGGTAFE